MDDLIGARIAKIEWYVAILDGLKIDCIERFGDPIVRGATLHYLYLMADSCVALAEMLLKRRGIPVPESYHAAIDQLGDHGIIPGAFAYSFAGIASFRNFLAHDYERIDARRICTEILEMLPEVKEYLGYVKTAPS